MVSDKDILFAKFSVLVSLGWLVVVWPSILKFDGSKKIFAKLAVCVYCLVGWWWSGLSSANAFIAADFKLQ